MSLWSTTTKLKRFEPLKGNAKTDVLIIGGGLAGILCAYMLKSSGIDYILVEQNTICSGVTKNTTAKITAQHGLIYNKLIRRFGEDTARMYLNANQAAVERYRELCKSIDCDFLDADSYVYSLDNEKKIETELVALCKLGFYADFCKTVPLPFSIAGAARFTNQAQFNPLKFAAAITKKLNAYENTRVLELTPSAAITNNGSIHAENIIVTTHFPFINKHGSYYMKLYQHRSYIIAYENAANVHGMYVDEAQDGMSFRNYKGSLLIGGGGHRTGKLGGGWNEISAFANKHYPAAREEYRWATQDCMTLDKIPYIGQYSKNTPHFYVATGFNKWGITSSMVAATLLTDMILKNENPYADVFAPSRSVLRPQLAVNALESAISLITPSKKRCPHMGCALKWNPFERSWDCPCHGSRFSKEGRLMNNPATGDLKQEGDEIK